MSRSIEVICEVCDKKYAIPMCRLNRLRRCSAECRKKAREIATKESIEKRIRACAMCGVTFTARQWQIDVGVGRYCSHRCASSNPAHIEKITTDSAKTKRLESWRKSLAEGKFRIPTGVDHPSWMGGPEAMKERDNSPERKEKRRQIVRAYRFKNPHKAREFQINRRYRKRGRLEYGTIPKLLELQREKCAICKTSIGCEYHVDHVIPLAKGGAHSKDNIQLLCGSCNVRKSAKDPIEYMQSLGYLL